MTDTLRIETVSTHAGLDRFLDLPFQLYRGNPTWVPPLRSRERARLDPARNPFLKHAERELFLAVRGRRTVGRVAAVHDQRRADGSGVFGFLECEDDAAACSALLDAAERWLKVRGATRMVGPINLSTFDEAGVLIEGHDRRPPLMTGHNPAYYRALLEGAGFLKQHDTLAFERELFEPDGSPCAPPPGLVAASGSSRDQQAIEIRPVRMEHWDEEISRIHPVLEETFKDLEGHVPLSQKAFAAMARQLRPILDPRMMLVAQAGPRIVGFAFLLPDINEVLAHVGGSLFPFGFLRAWWWRSRIQTVSFKLAGVLSEYRKGGLAARLALESSLAAQRIGYRRMEISVVLESNRRMREFVELQGAKPYRRYRTYVRACA